VCRSKHIEQLRNSGIINSTTRSHLVGYFYTICIMMYGSMNIKRNNELDADFLPMLYLIMLSAKWLNSISALKSLYKKITNDLVERDQHSEKMSD